MKRLLILLKEEDAELREEGIRLIHALSVGNVRFPPWRTSHKVIIKTIIQVVTMEKIIELLHDKAKEIVIEAAITIGIPYC